LIVFASALLLFSINLDRPPPNPDELHHALAAQHLIETGRPILAEGEYERGILHTWMVALSYAAFGESLPSARIPSVLLVALTALILFLWVRREADSLAAWVTALLFISSPFTVEIAQFSRFYALQILSFVLGTLCCYYSLVAALSFPRRVLLGAVAIGLYAIAASAQFTTYVGLVGVAVWTFGMVLQRVYFNPAASAVLKKATTALIIISVVLMILAVSATDLAQWAWHTHQSTPLFNIERQSEFWFYHLRFLLFYPTLWTLVGFLAVLAIVRSHKLAWLSICIFSISFLLMSFAGSKATRYISFAPPFLAIVWGLGLACVAPPLQRYAEATRTRMIETLALPQRFGSMVGIGITVVVLAMVVLMNPFWLRSATVIGGIDLPTETPTENWRAARETLAGWVADADIMITTEELGAIYFLGRADVAFSPSKIPELRNQRFDFGIDYRTGRPVIAKPESLERLIDCFQSGFVVGPIRQWGSPIGITEEAQAVLLRRATPIEVPEKSNLFAWGWTYEPWDERPGNCSELNQLPGLARQAGSP
jgi:hypothetical protein